MSLGSRTTKLGSQHKHATPSLGSLADQPLKLGSKTTKLGSLGSQLIQSMPSLGSLANQNMSLGFKTTKLGSQGSQHTQATSCLGSLANHHLGSPATYSLGSLANNHLGSPTPEEGRSQFRILAIFGGISEEAVKEGEGDIDIDLSAALKLSAEVTGDMETLEEELPPLTQTVLALPDLRKTESSLLRKRKECQCPVLAWRWRRLLPFLPLALAPLLPTQSFSFTQPSPDALVLQAQAQSRAFTARK